MKNINIKRFVVESLCPDIIKDDNSLRVQNLKLVLSNNAKIRRFNNKYICVVDNDQYVFDERPSEELLKKYETATNDPERKIRAVDDLLKEILCVTQNTSAFRKVRPIVQDPPCKNCGNKEYHDCNTHYTCKRCAAVRTKFHEGLAYREMRDRNIDMNGRSMEISNIYSEMFQRRSEVRLCYAGEKKSGISKRELKSLQQTCEKMNNYKEYNKDKQMFLALDEMETICAPLQMRDGVVRKAHVLYCMYRKKVRILRNESAVIAACLFHALPDEIKIVHRKRPKPIEHTSPKVKQRKLKYVDFKKPFKKRKRSHSLMVRLREKRLKKVRKKASSFG